MVADDFSSADPLSDEQAEVLQYRSISSLAVVALLLGALSILALTAPLLLVVPLAACCVAFAAVAAIARAPERLAGTRLAYAGLFLAIAFGVAAVVRIELRTRLLENQAAEAVEDWVDLIATSQWEAAIARLSGRGKEKLHPPTTPGEPPPPMVEVHAYRTRELASSPLAQRLTELPTPVVVRLLKSTTPPTFRGRNVTVQSVYEVSSDDSGDDPFRMTVQLTRAPVFEEEGLSLRIDDWAIGSPPDAR